MREKSLSQISLLPLFIVACKYLSLLFTILTIVAGSYSYPPDKDTDSCEYEQPGSWRKAEIAFFLLNAIISFAQGLCAVADNGHAKPILFRGVGSSIWDCALLLMLFVTIPLAITVSVWALFPLFLLLYIPCAKAELFFALYANPTSLYALIFTTGLTLGLNGLARNAGNERADFTQVTVGGLLIDTITDYFSDYLSAVYPDLADSPEVSLRDRGESESSFFYSGEIKEASQVAANEGEAPVRVLSSWV